MRAAAPRRAVPSRRAVAPRLPGENWSREGGLLPRRSLSTRRSFTRRPVREGGNGLTSQRLNAFTLPKQRERVSAARRAVASRVGGFTLLELLIVVGIIALLLVLISPAFTYIKGGTDVTSAAYTIQGVLDTARTYAKANNTYTWVGFFEEDVSLASTTPATSGVGRVVMSIIASKGGTMLYTGNLTNSLILDGAPNQTALIQVGKLTKIDNVHLKGFTAATATPPPDSFDTRPVVTSTAAQIGDNNFPPNPAITFHYPVGTSPGQYPFTKVIQFSPRGEAVVTNNSYAFAPFSEIGVEPTHGAVVPTSTPANVCAVQLSGLGGNSKIYQR